MSAISLHQVSLPQPVSLQGRKTSKRSISSKSGGPSAAPFRLTRRGQIVLIGVPLVLLAVLLVSLSGLFNSPAKASDSAADLAVTPTVTVTVQAGQSLWSIAGAVAPDRDARDVVADIVQLNNLSAGAVLPGQQLFVPTR
ncbi:LysM domain-containing protein [Arthrobacter sp. SLBN-112]|jgi:LysM repeat protein|nr:LysM peptidoglycan-binding domain-containing protein [Arthrobacter sp. SLBN-112]TQJ40473.1 LysM domain-containing protein [Arthrobacter sp. SLBN-112]